MFKKTFRFGFLISALLVFWGAVVAQAQVLPDRSNYEVRQVGAGGTVSESVHHLIGGRGHEWQFDNVLHVRGDRVLLKRQAHRAYPDDEVWVPKQLVGTAAYPKPVVRRTARVICEEFVQCDSDLAIRKFVRLNTFKLVDMDRVLSGSEEIRVFANWTPREIPPPPKKVEGEVGTLKKLANWLMQKVSSAGSYPMYLGAHADTSTLNRIAVPIGLLLLLITTWQGYRSSKVSLVALAAAPGKNISARLLKTHTYSYIIHSYSQNLAIDYSRARGKYHYLPSLTRPFDVNRYDWGVFQEFTDQFASGLMRVLPDSLSDNSPHYCGTKKRQWMGDLFLAPRSG